MSNNLKIPGNFDFAQQALADAIGELVVTTSNSNNGGMVTKILAGAALVPAAILAFTKLQAALGPTTRFMKKEGLLNMGKRLLYGERDNEVTKAPEESNFHQIRNKQKIEAKKLPSGNLMTEASNVINRRNLASTYKDEDKIFFNPIGDDIYLDYLDAKMPNSIKHYPVKVRRELYYEAGLYSTKEAVMFAVKEDPKLASYYGIDKDGNIRFNHPTLSDDTIRKVWRARLSKKIVEHPEFHTLKNGGLAKRISKNKEIMNNLRGEFGAFNANMNYEKIKFVELAMNAYHPLSPYTVKDIADAYNTGLKINDPDDRERAMLHAPLEKKWERKILSNYSNVTDKKVASNVKFKDTTDFKNLFNSTYHSLMRDHGISKVNAMMEANDIVHDHVVEENRKICRVYDIDESILNTLEYTILGDKLNRRNNNDNYGLKASKKIDLYYGESYPHGFGDRDTVEREMHLCMRVKISKQLGLQERQSPNIFTDSYVKHLMIAMYGEDGYQSRIDMIDRDDASELRMHMKEAYSKFMAREMYLVETGDADVDIFNDISIDIHDQLNDIVRRDRNGEISSHIENDKWALGELRESAMYDYEFIQLIEEEMISNNVPLHYDMFLRKTNTVDIYSQIDRYSAPVIHPSDVDEYGNYSPRGFTQRTIIDYSSPDEVSYGRRERYNAVYQNDSSIYNIRRDDYIEYDNRYIDDDNSFSASLKSESELYSIGGAGIYHFDGVTSGYSRLYEMGSIVDNDDYRPVAKTNAIKDLDSLSRTIDEEYYLDEGASTYSWKDMKTNKQPSTNRTRYDGDDGHYVKDSNERQSTTASFINSNDPPNMDADDKYNARYRKLFGNVQSYSEYDDVMNTMYGTDDNNIRPLRGRVLSDTTEPDEYLYDDRGYVMGRHDDSIYDYETVEVFDESGDIIGTERIRRRPNYEHDLLRPLPDYDNNGYTTFKMADKRAQSERISGVSIYSSTWVDPYPGKPFSAYVDDPFSDKFPKKPDDLTDEEWELVDDGIDYTKIYPIDIIPEDDIIAALTGKLSLYSKWGHVLGSPPYPAGYVPSRTNSNQKPMSRTGKVMILDDNY